jgi:hypothetical protein
MHAALSEYFDMNSDEYLYIFGTNIEKNGFFSHLKTEVPLNVYLYKNHNLENMA